MNCRPKRGVGWGGGWGLGGGTFSSLIGGGGGGGVRTIISKRLFLGKNLNAKGQL